MLTEPTPLVVAFLRSHTQGEAFVSGDWIGRPQGKAAVIVDYDGGWRTVRDRMDRPEFTVHVYAQDRDATSALAFRLRDLVLTAMPGHVWFGVQVADVEELAMPSPTPDETSREWRYTFAFAAFLFEL